MLDTTQALADMARQVRACRSADGLTLQQLATRSGVAASTIHKVESRQMVPTVSVLLKIAKGLGRRPEELIRDDVHAEAVFDDAPPIRSGARCDVGVWELELSAERPLPLLDLEPQQRAIFLAESGGITLSTGSDRSALGAGDCVAIEGGPIEASIAPGDGARVLIIVTPPAGLVRVLGDPGRGEPTR